MVFVGNGFPEIEFWELSTAVDPDPSLCKPNKTFRFCFLQSSFRFVFRRYSSFNFVQPSTKIQNPAVGDPDCEDKDDCYAKYIFAIPRDMACLDGRCVARINPKA
ncbi:hypothetical protein P8452_64776 [Trifolium repens]|nr:hypothetical protein P8452_64776 [Trifolium repens]WJX81957.1 hypothetical protein P8452_64776 [Trifolium repens]